MLDKIIEEETILADKANEEREEYKNYKNNGKKEKEAKLREERNLKIFGGIFGFWLLGLIALLFKVYKKHDKELEPDFKQQYFRDFPDESSPEEVQLLIYNKIDALGLSSSLLNIIRKRINN